MFKYVRLRTAAVVLAALAVVVSGCSSSSKSNTSSSPTTASAGSGSGVKLSFPTTTFNYGTAGADELPVNPPAPSGGNGGATAPGVTATSIEVGQVISLTGPAAGLFAGIGQSAQAYADYVNSLGGVYGRKIHINLADDAFDVTKAGAACQNLIPKVFALVGDFSLGDAGCYPLIKSSGIPELTPIVFDPQLFALPNVFAPQPVTYSSLEPATELALHPNVKKVWLCEQNAPGIAAQAAPETKVWQSLGVQVLNLPPLPSGLPDYTAYVIRARDAGAQAVDCFSTQPQITAQIAHEMAQQGWNPEIKRGFSVYNTDFVKLAGSAGKGWTTGIQVPALDSSVFLSTPVGQLYKKWTGQLPTNGTNPYYGWEYMDMFVQGLVRAGPNLTQGSLESALQSMKDFTAGGLVPPQPTKGAGTLCLSLVEDNGSGLVQIHPSTPGQMICGGTYYSASS
jgi:ABC-type branched-subunit amino acid transport system substrate-binding protein